MALRQMQVNLVINYLVVKNKELLFQDSINLTKDVFILDEPTSSLDEISELIIIDLIKYLEKLKNNNSITHSKHLTQFLIIFWK